MLVDGHLYNVVFSAVMSVLTNLIMIIVVSHSQKLTFAYRGQLYVAASISLFYTSVNVFVNPTIAVIPEDRSVLFVKGGFDTSFAVANFLLDIFVVLMVISAIHPTIQFVYRYLHIVHSKLRHIWENGLSWLLLLFPISLALTSSISFCYEVEPNCYEIERYNETVYYINILGYTSFLKISNATASIETFENDYGSMVTMYYTATVMFLANAVILISALSIRKFLSMNHFSLNTTKLHKQLNKTLTAQALIPFVTIHLPFYASCLAPTLGWTIFVLSEYLPYLFSYYSVLMPLSVIFYAKVYYYEPVLKMFQDVRKMLYCTKTKIVSGSSSNMKNRGR